MKLSLVLSRSLRCLRMIPLNIIEALDLNGWSYHHYTPIVINRDKSYSIKINQTQSSVIINHIQINTCLMVLRWCYSFASEVDSRRILQHCVAQYAAWGNLCCLFILSELFWVFCFKCRETSRNYFWLFLLWTWCNAEAADSGAEVEDVPWSLHGLYLILPEA